MNAAEGKSPVKPIVGGRQLTEGWGVAGARSAGNCRTMIASDFRRLISEASVVRRPKLQDIRETPCPGGLMTLPAVLNKNALSRASQWRLMIR